jgi:hypothetical protein
MYAMVDPYFFLVSMTTARSPAAPSPIAIIVPVDMPPLEAGKYADADATGPVGADFGAEKLETTELAIAPQSVVGFVIGDPFGVHWPLMPANT